MSGHRPPEGTHVTYAEDPVFPGDWFADLRRDDDGAVIETGSGTTREAARAHLLERYCRRQAEAAAVPAAPAGAGTPVIVEDDAPPTLEEGTSGRVSPVALAVQDMTIVRLGDEDAPDVKVWTRKLSTGVRTYRWVPAEAMDAYLAEVDADPDREVIDPDAAPDDAPDPHAARASRRLGGDR